jgi:hypothetical protein
MGLRIVLLSGCVAVLLATPVPAQAQRLSLPGVLGAPLHILNGMVGAVRRGIRGGSRHGISRRSAARRAAPAAAASAAVETTGSASAGIESSGGNAAASVWNGPLFWPNAYDGMFEYAFGIEDGEKFWARGYGDVIEGMFMPARTSRVASAENDKQSWAALCGGDTQGSAQAIASRVRDAVKPTAEQEAAFEELSSSLTRGFDAIKAVCPTDRAATPTERLNLMIARLSAMRQAVLSVSNGAKAFYATLSDEQKAAFDGSAEGNGALCAGGPVEWPQRDIARLLRPTKQQYPELERLRQTSMHLGQFVGSTCPGERPKTTVERLDAVKERLSALRYAALNTGPALNRFYLALNSEQKQRLGAPAIAATTDGRR